MVIELSRLEPCQRFDINVLFQFDLVLIAVVLVLSFISVYPVQRLLKPMINFLLKELIENAIALLVIHLVNVLQILLCIVHLLILSQLSLPLDHPVIILPCFILEHLLPQFFLLDLIQVDLMALHDLQSILMQHSSMHLFVLFLLLMQHPLIEVNILLNFRLMQLVFDGHSIFV